MDKFRILVIAAGVSVLIAFSVYTFSDIFPSNIPGAGTKIQPVGSSAASSGSKDNGLSQDAGQTDANGSKSLNKYENMDKQENHYSIQLPSDANVVHGNRAGSYVANTDYGLFASRLQDIPDDTTVQLYVLTHDEGELKSSLDNYRRVSFDEGSISGHRSYDLVYTWQNATKSLTSERTYIEGSDEAMIIEYVAPNEVFASNNSTMNAVKNSFQWLV